jgi:hypothetical protein
MGLSLGLGLDLGRRGGRTSGGAGGPAARAGSTFAAVAHPACCRSDAGNTTPCGDGDRIRWWQDLVSGTWYEQATEALRPILRASGGKWYAEGSSAGNRHFRFGPIVRPTEVAIAVRSQVTPFDASYSGFVNQFGGSGQRWALTNGGGTQLFSDPEVRSALRNGVATTGGPFWDLAPITSWMQVQYRIATGSATPADVLLFIYDGASFSGDLDISAVAVFAADRTTEEQAGDLAWLQSFTP